MKNTLFIIGLLLVCCACSGHDSHTVTGVNEYVTDPTIDYDWSACPDVLSAQDQVTAAFAYLKDLMEDRDTAEGELIDLNNRLASSYFLSINGIACKVKNVNSNVNNSIKLIKKANNDFSNLFIQLQLVLSQFIKDQNTQFAYLQKYTYDAGIVSKLEKLIDSNLSPAVEAALQEIRACIKVEQYNNQVFVKNVIVNELTLRGHIVALTKLAGTNPFPVTLLSFENDSYDNLSDIQYLIDGINSKQSSVQNQMHQKADDLITIRGQVWDAIRAFNKAKAAYFNAGFACKNLSYISEIDRIISLIKTCEEETCPCHFDVPCYHHEKPCIPECTCNPAPPVETCPPPQPPCFDFICVDIPNPQPPECKPFERCPPCPQ